jgi:hypothetical protein
MEGEDKLVRQMIFVEGGTQMFQANNANAQEFIFWATNGTTAMSTRRWSQGNLPENSRWFAIVNPAPTNVFIVANKRHVAIKPPIRLEVIASLERSLKENAEVWIELSKH